MLDPNDLNDWEKQVLAAAEAGERAWLEPRPFDDIKSLGGLKKRDFDKDDDGNYLPLIRAAFLERLLLQGDPDWTVHYRGIRFNYLFWSGKSRGLIKGDLDLRGAGSDSARLPILEITGFRFDARPDFEMAWLTQLVLNDCSLPQGLDLDKADIKGSVFFRGAAVMGEIRMHGVRIGSQLSMERARLAHPGAIALNVDGAEIASSVFLDHARVVGETNFMRTRIGDALSLRGARLANPAGNALQAGGATISGGVFARRDGDSPGLTALGACVFTQATVGVTLDFKGAVLVAEKKGFALAARNLRLDGNAYFTRVEEHPFCALGGFTLHGASIEGSITLEKAILTSLDAAKRPPGDEDFMLYRAFGFSDSVQQGDLSLKEAIVLGAIDLDGRRITGDVLLEGAALSASGKIRQDLDMDDADWTDHAEKNKEGVSLSTIRTRIEGALCLPHFKAPDLEAFDKIAPNYMGEEDIEFFGEPAREFNEKIKAAIAAAKETAQQAICQPAEEADESKDYCHPHGHMLLWNAHLGSLYDHPALSWPKTCGHLHIDGLQYDHLHIIPRKDRPHPLRRAWDRLRRKDEPLKADQQAVYERRLKWLDLQYKDKKPEVGEFRPQPYQQLAKALRAQGFGSDANKVGAERRNLARICRADAWWDRFVSRIFAWTSESGYSMGRVTAVYVAVLAGLTAVNGLLYMAGSLEPNCAVPALSFLPGLCVNGDFRGPFDAFAGITAYSADTYLPLITFGAAEELVPAESGWGHVAAIWKALTAIIGAIMTAILVLTYTGITRGD